MQIFNHPFIECRKFYEIKTLEDIKKTPSNSVLLSDFDKKIITYCKTQNLVFGVRIASVKELVLAAASNASYLLVNKDFAKTAQQIADEYMYDAKILLISDDEEDIEFCALNGIDGIFFT
ncbi:MAG: hypothetical protein R3331_08585 [Sulfurospirillaceae bacterium]|nr:hypothetical protein [Sulfurospirillaceae bacterium]